MKHNTCFSKPFVESEKVIVSLANYVYSRVLIASILDIYQVNVDFSVKFLFSNNDSSQPQIKSSLWSYLGNFNISSISEDHNMKWLNAIKSITEFTETDEILLKERDSSQITLPNIENHSDLLFVNLLNDDIPFSITKSLDINEISLDSLLSSNEFKNINYSCSKSPFLLRTNSLSSIVVMNSKKLNKFRWEHFKDYGDVSVEDTDFCNLITKDNLICYPEVQEINTDITFLNNVKDSINFSLTLPNHLNDFENFVIIINAYFFSNEMTISKQLVLIDKDIVSFYFDVIEPDTSKIEIFPKLCIPLRTSFTMISVTISDSKIDCIKNINKNILLHLQNVNKTDNFEGTMWNIDDFSYETKSAHFEIITSDSLRINSTNIEYLTCQSFKNNNWSFINKVYKLKFQTADFSIISNFNIDNISLPILNECMSNLTFFRSLTKETQEKLIESKFNKSFKKTIDKKMLENSIDSKRKIMMYKEQSKNSSLEMIDLENINGIIGNDLLKYKIQCCLKIIIKNVFGFLFETYINVLCINRIYNTKEFKKKQDFHKLYSKKISMFDKKVVSNSDSFPFGSSKVTVVNKSYKHLMSLPDLYERLVRKNIDRNYNNETKLITDFDCYYSLPKNIFSNLWIEYNSLNHLLCLLEQALNIWLNFPRLHIEFRFYIYRIMEQLYYILIYIAEKVFVTSLIKLCDRYLQELKLLTSGPLVNVYVTIVVIRSLLHIINEFGKELTIFKLIPNSLKLLLYKIYMKFKYMDKKNEAVSHNNLVNTLIKFSGCTKQIPETFMNSFFDRRLKVLERRTCCQLEFNKPISNNLSQSNINFPFLPYNDDVQILNVTHKSTTNQSAKIRGILSMFSSFIQASNLKIQVTTPVECEKTPPIMSVNGFCPLQLQWIDFKYI